MFPIEFFYMRMYAKYEAKYKTCVYLSFYKHYYAKLKVRINGFLFKFMLLKPKGTNLMDVHVNICIFCTNLLNRDYCDLMTIKLIYVKAT